MLQCKSSYSKKLRILISTMNLASTTCENVWTIMYAIPGFSSQKDFFLCHQIFLISGSGEGVSGEEARNHSFLLIQWTPMGWAWQGFSLSSHCPVSQCTGCGMGAKQEKMMVGQFQALTGTFWSTPLSSMFFC